MEAAVGAVLDAVYGEGNWAAVGERLSTVPVPTLSVLCTYFPNFSSLCSYLATTADNDALLWELPALPGPSAHRAGTGPPMQCGPVARWRAYCGDVERRLRRTAAADDEDVAARAPFPPSNPGRSPAVRVWGVPPVRKRSEHACMAVRH